MSSDHRLSGRPQRPLITHKIFVDLRVHYRIGNIELECMRFVVGGIVVILDHRSNLVVYFLHAFRVTADAGESVAHRGIAGSRIGHDTDGSFVQPNPVAVNQKIACIPFGRLNIISPPSCVNASG